MPHDALSSSRLTPEQDTEALLPASTTPRVFTFPDTRQPVRTVTREGEPWFVLADVCLVLAHSNPSVAAARLDNDEKGVSSVYTPGGLQAMTVISESGLYSLILTSRKPEARAFRRWVTGTVLPNLRRDGAYVMGEERLSDPASSVDDLEALNDRIVSLLRHKAELLEARVEREKASRLAAEATVQVMAPKAALVDEHFAQAGTMTLARFARTLGGLNAHRIKADLERYGFLYRTGRKGSYRVRTPFRDTLFVEKAHPAHPGTIEIHPTPKGCQRIVALYQSGQLTMKLGHWPKAPTRVAA